MPGLNMTEDELVAYLQNTALPTLLVEGVGDKSLLRRLEALLRKRDIDILPVGGKGLLHNVYIRKQEFALSKVAFLRDRDEWSITNVPPGYEEYVFTSGYSIENDVLDQVVIEALLKSEMSMLSTQIEMLAEWFRHAVYRMAILVDGCCISRDVSQIIVDGAYTPDALLDMDGLELPTPFSSLDLKKCWVWLRGKSLLRMVHAFIVKEGSNYSKDQILDLSLRMGKNNALPGLIERISSKF